MPNVQKKAAWNVFELTQMAARSSVDIGRTPHEAVLKLQPQQIEFCEYK